MIDFGKPLSGKLMWVLIFFIVFWGGNSLGFSQGDDDLTRIPKKLNDGWDVSSLTAEGIAEGPIEEVTGLIPRG